jgi:hypothetical protein
MNFARTIIAVFLLAILAMWAQEAVRSPVAAQVQSRFGAFDLFVDSGDRALAAYQIEFIATSGDVKIAGIEGGEHAAFHQPPYYDPRAIQHERAILAGFNMASSDKLPRGRTRVATIHVRIGNEREPKFELKLHTAATSDGQPISVQTSFKERNTR